MNYLEDKLLRPVLVRALSQTIDRLAKPISVFARTACVGNTLLSKTFRKGRIDILHLQKARIDFLSEELTDSTGIEFIDVEEVPYFNPNSREWHSQLQNKELLDKFLKADFSLFDSFCELTDNKFLFSHNDISFSSYGQLSDFNCESLLPNLIEIQSVEKAFSNLLTYKLNVESNSPVIWLHYSAKNESRKRYVERAGNLLELAHNLESRFKFFYVLKLEEFDYHFSELDYFPYHYSRKTTDLLSQRLSDILRKNDVATSRYTYNI